MVAKGHHFPGREAGGRRRRRHRAGAPDLRAEERTFQLVTQLAGRSGRDAPGSCSCRPSSRMRPRSVYAARHDVAGFLAQELERRRELAYPPYSHLVSLVVSGADAAAPERVLREIRGRLEGLGAELLGPAPLLRLRTGTGRNSSPRRTTRAVWRARPLRFSKRRRRRFAVMGSVRSSTSIRNRCEPIGFRACARLRSTRVEPRSRPRARPRPRPRPRPRSRSRGRGRRRGCRGRASCAQAARVRADPPVRRRRAADGRQRGRELRRGARRARRADDRAHARRRRCRARRDAGRDFPALLRVLAGRESIVRSSIR